MTQFGTVRQSDSLGRHALGGPNLQALSGYREPDGKTRHFVYYPFLSLDRSHDIVGRHHLSYAWALNICDGVSFKTNLYTGPVARHA